MKTMRAVVHGKTIELPEETGLPDGQEVTVTLERCRPSFLQEKAFAVPPALGPRMP